MNKVRRFLVYQVGKIIPDSVYIQVKYFKAFHRFANLRHPKTFNEKLNWLKLHGRNEQYTVMVDKYEMKEYVSGIIGSQYVVPTLGGPWNSFDEIDFDSLPEQFVLKTTHDCGGVVICKGKEAFDIKEARAFLNQHLKNEYYWTCREWPYKNVKPRIFAEQYLEDSVTGELHDYKFFCFDGQVKALFIATDRGKQGEEVKFDFFDFEFNHLPVINGHSNANQPLKKPENFELMKQLASKISKGIPHIRVDLYEVDGKIYVGELTFFHFGGLVPFQPAEWDYTFGDWLKL